MPGPTTERLDEDVRSLREEFQDFKVLLARIDARLATLDDFKLEVKAGFDGLRTEAKEFKAEVKADSDKLYAEVKGFKAEVKADSDKLHAEVKEFKAEVKADSDKLRAEVKSDFEKVETAIKDNTASIATLDGRVLKLDARVDWIAGITRLVFTIFALAAAYGVVGITSRLGVVETELKNVDARLGELKTAIDRRPSDTSAELDERIRRIARAVVDEAAKQASATKPAP